MTGAAARAAIGRGRGRRLIRAGTLGLAALVVSAALLGCAMSPAAAAWKPPALDGEAGWSLGHIVGHIGASRLYFASAYRGEGWITLPPEHDPEDQRTWLPWLRASAARFTALLKDTPDAWLT